MTRSLKSVYAEGELEVQATCYRISRIDMMTDWKQTTLGDEIELVYGKSLPKRDRVDEDYPVYGSNGVVGYHNKSLVQGPGIIIGRKGSCGEVHYSNSDFWPIDTTYYVNLIKKNNMKFIAYYLSSLGLNHMNSHSTIPGLNRKNVYEIDCQFPPLPEQKKIAAVLYKIQKAIEVQEKIIESTKELKKATMQHLFTKGLHCEKTKQTEIGEIPESWELKPISECYDFTKKPRNLSYGDYKEIAFIPMELIPNSGVRSNEYILKSANDISSGTYFETGDILVSKITPCFENGKQCVIDEIPNDFGIATTEVIPIKEIPDMSDKYFLFYYLLKPDVRSYIAVKMEGATGRQRVPIHLLKDLLIPFPSLPEQKKISSIFLAIDRKIDICDSKRNNLQNLFKSMLNGLMTGELRVKDLKIDVGEIEDSRSREVKEAREKP